MNLGDLKVKLGELTGQSRLYRVGPKDDLPVTIRPVGEDFTLAIVDVRLNEETEEIELVEASE